MAVERGRGASFKWDNNTIGDVVSISGPGMTSPDIDTTNLASDWATSVPGIPDGGSFTVTVQAVTSLSTMMTSIGQNAYADCIEAWEIVFPSTAKIAGNGYLTGINLESIEPNNIITYTLTVRVTGEVTYTAGA